MGDVGEEIKQLQEDPSNMDLIKEIVTKLSNFHHESIMTNMYPGSVQYYDNLEAQKQAEIQKQIENNIKEHPEFNYRKCQEDCTLEDVKLKHLLDTKAPFVDTNVKKKKELCLEKCELFNARGGEYSPYPFPTDFKEEVDKLR